MVAKYQTSWRLFCNVAVTL
uniref:Uncharacterized protein n=1 Tax=Anguilla anguilla TaxID=7936 RepID=A0A0E9PS84_ANGAN